jgi:hypothetical protein
VGVDDRGHGRVGFHHTHGDVLEAGDVTDPRRQGSRRVRLRDRDDVVRTLVGEEFEHRRGGSRRASEPRDPDRAWSPAGDRIVFNARRDLEAKLYIKPSNGAVADELLLSTGKNVWGNDWSRDGKFLLYSEDGFPDAKMDLFVLPLDEPRETRKPIPYLTGPFNKKQGQFSPDRRFGSMLVILC